MWLYTEIITHNMRFKFLWFQFFLLRRKSGPPYTLSCLTRKRSPKVLFEWKENISEKLYLRKYSH